MSGSDAECHAGVVHENVDRPHVCGEFERYARDGSSVAHVEGKGMKRRAKFAAQRFEPLDPSPASDDLRPIAQKPARDRLAETGGRTADEDYDGSAPAGTYWAMPLPKDQFTRGLSLNTIRTSCGRTRPAAVTFATMFAYKARFLSSLRPSARNI